MMNSQTLEAVRCLEDGDRLAAEVANRCPILRWDVPSPTGGLSCIDSLDAAWCASGLCVPATRDLKHGGLQAMLRDLAGRAGRCDPLAPR
jgi:hypothetical protein